MRSTRRILGAALSLAAILTAGSAGVAGAATRAAPSASAATDGCSLAPTAGTVTRTVGRRSYRVNVPAGLSGPRVPLLLSLHGAGSTGAQDELFTGWTPFAASHPFIVAYPQARGVSFSGLWDPYTPVSTDVADLKAMAADIAAQWCVDPQRIHVDGWSNGAVMSQRVACDGADTFASVTSYAGGTPSLAGLAAPCSPSRPIAVGLIAGQFDFTYGGLAQNTDEWTGINDCAATPARSTDAFGTSELYTCAGGVRVLSRVVGLTSHNWPSGARGEDQRSRMWAFFEAHPRP
ncbi:hypothetical protein DSM112329_00638 [Paraconexibacter sp. AEG42_29]|uniref:Peptidase S9 prolyl oligopeptidase catalytic domain-containing protein n=1 Tax=Paraconexibacter sp. AEG42_29 TaxID=2997339 RepID=A0AAU7AQ88_9ACTN